MSKLRSARRFFLWALLSGVVSASALKFIYRFDPMMDAAKDAIVGDPRLTVTFGDVSKDDVNIFNIVKAGDASRTFETIEYTAAVSGSRHGGRVKVLVKRSYSTGRMLGDPVLVELKVRD